MTAMMVAALKPEHGGAERRLWPIKGRRIDLELEGRARAFFIHELDGVEILSDFRSGLRVPRVDLSIYDPQTALDIALHPISNATARMDAAEQLNIV